MTDINKSEPVKIIKQKGPIRFEAIIPFFLVCFAVWLYFVLFFDTHFRLGLEMGLSSGNGAETNIGSVRTSFWNASLDIKNIQLTDPENPINNRVQVESVRFKMLWDALLRGKIVIDEASVNNIAIQTPRKNRGKVPPPLKASDEPSAAQKLAEKTLGRAADKLEGNVLGDVATMIEDKGGKEQVNLVADQLKSNIRAKELEKELKEKEKEWKSRFESLPKPKEFEDLSQKLKDMKFNTKNPVEFAAQLKEAGRITKEIENKFENLKATGGLLTGDIDKYGDAIKDLEKIAKDDIDDLEARLKIPKLDTKNLANVLFGPEIFSKVNMIENYKKKYEKYLPPKKSKEEKAAEKLEAHERAKGKNYQFGRPMSYPLFWLKLAKVSSTSTEAGFSGDVLGEVRNVTTDPKHLGLPITVNIKGDFPKQQYTGLSAQLTLDRTKDQGVDTLLARIGSFPVGQKSLSNSTDVKFGFEKARGGSDIKAQVIGESLEMTVKNSFSEIGYQIEAKNKIVDEVLKGVAAGIPVVTLDASVKGSLKDLDMSIRSNLAEAIEQGFKKQIDLKIKEAREKLNKFVNDAINQQKQKLNAQFNEIKSKFQKEIDSKKAEVDKIKQQAQAKLEESKKSALDSGKKEGQEKAKEKANEKGREALKDLKKKFKL
ncbi:MAG: TIGR03545 family protein [Pseudomonadota bacterium]|nr:TIGR03545 family protein [Pseudomonadota bacterium]